MAAICALCSGTAKFNHNVRLLSAMTSGDVCDLLEEVLTDLRSPLGSSRLVEPVLKQGDEQHQTGRRIVQNDMNGEKSASFYITQRDCPTLKNANQRPWPGLPDSEPETWAWQIEPGQVEQDQDSRAYLGFS